MASITAWPTWAANPSATRMTPSEKRLDDSAAMSLRRPPRRRASGPADARTATARVLTFRTSPQFAQVSISADAAERAHRADDGELVVAALAAERPGRIDQAVAAAVRQADREDRLAVGADLGDPRALLEARP